MPKKHSFDDWECLYCGAHYSLSPLALGCERTHEIILVPIQRSDLQKLIQFLYTKDDTLLGESLMKTLMKYQKAKVKRDADMSDM